MSPAVVLELASARPSTRPDAHTAIVRWLGSHWPATADTYRRALELVPLATAGTRDLASVQWERLDAQSLGAIRERLHQRYRASTVNRTLRAVRSMARALEEQHVITPRQLASLMRVRDLRTPWSASKTGRMIGRDAQRALLDACDAAPSPRFHRALCALLLAGGLRKAEAAGFLMSDLADYDPASGRLLVRHGKGRKERTVYFAGTARAALDAFVAGDDRGWRYQRLGTSQVGATLRRLVLRADIGGCSPHDLRRTFASEHFARGTDIATLQELMGHASPTTTAAYDRRGEERKAQAAYDPWR